MRLIDIFRNRNELVAWLLDRGKNVFLPCRFQPKIYAFSYRKELERLRRKLEQHRIPCGYVERKTLNGIKRVLAIETTITGRAMLIRDIHSFSDYAIELYNADTPLEEQYIFSQHVFPNCKVKVRQEGDVIVGMEPLEEQTAEYRLPKLKAATLKVHTSYPLERNLDAELLAIVFDDKRYEGPGMVDRFVKAFQKKDPDIIITDRGTLELPYLLDVIRKHHPLFSFSRFGKDNLSVEGKSYVVYGRTIFKRNAVYLNGRIHFQKIGVLYGSWNMWYPFELARLCRVTLQRINSRSPGYGVSNLQQYHAMDKGFLIPRTTSCVERWKSGQELFDADRGSLIYEPVVGFHNDIAELDFISLYPSIMVRKNISAETMFCRCCKDNNVPGLKMNICSKERGIMAVMLEPIIQQRLKYKRSKDEADVSRADALKGILVTSFGYMGFKKSKLARIEAHQAIQAYARDLLLEASKIAEEHGFDVIHGITDSLWVKKQDVKRAEVDRLAGEIESRTGFAIKVEGLYRWMVFLPSTQNVDIPVPTRFYGVFDDGEVKVRGIEIRRRDMPQIVKDLQAAMIERIADAGDEAEFLARMRKAIMLMRATIRRILDGNVSQEELMMTKSISKTNYSGKIAQSIVLEQLNEQGFDVQPGNYLQYVIRHKNASIAKNRYAMPQERFTYDREEYARLIRTSVSNMFLPFIRNGLEERQLDLMESLAKNRLLVTQKL